MRTPNTTPDKLSIVVEPQDLEIEDIHETDPADDQHWDRCSDPDHDWMWAYCNLKNGR